MGQSVSVICHTSDCPGGQSKLFFDLAGEELKSRPLAASWGALAAQEHNSNWGFKAGVSTSLSQRLMGHLSVPHTPSWACRARMFMVSLSRFPAPSQLLIAPASASSLGPATSQTPSCLRAPDMLFFLHGIFPSSHASSLISNATS